MLLGQPTTHVDLLSKNAWAELTQAPLETFAGLTQAQFPSGDDGRCGAPASQPHCKCSCLWAASRLALRLEQVCDGLSAAQPMAAATCTAGAKAVAAAAAAAEKMAGRMTRNTAEYLPVSVYPVTATFKSRNGRFRFERYLFPIVLACAVTTHIVQGLSVDKAVINLGKSVFAHDQAYTALKS